MKKILFIEDDMGLALTVKDRLNAEGYDVTHLPGGEKALDELSTQSYDLVLLDLMLKGKSGYDLCSDFRSKGYNLPVIMLTALGQTQDKVLGLKLGADDYVTKPFDSLELIARIEALIRRTGNGFTENVKFQFGDFEIDFIAMEVTKNGIPLEFSSKEFQLLRYLIINRGRSVSRNELLENVWGYDSNITTRTIDTHIGWLRQKIEADAKNPKLIRTVFGHGYKFLSK
jgi:two-component system, OmpR family, alkaline phosphatase synthesis response regulator PhoP